MKALSTFHEKIPAILCAVVLRCRSRAADRGFGSARKGKSKEMKRTEYNSRWPLVANAINKINNY